MEPVTASLITAGLAAGSSAGNAVAQGRMNKKTMAYNREMYDKQKADNIAFWNMQNEYNSPQAQMARLQAAGLNPNLVYGNGAVANSSSSVQTPHAMPYRPTAPSYSLGDIVERYQNVKMQQAQYDNVKQQGNNMILDALNKTEELRSKTNMNDYMERAGFRSKEKLEANKAQITTEELFKSILTNEFLSGAPAPGTTGEIKPGGMLSYQLDGAKLLNQLRRSEMQGKGLTNEMRKIDLDRAKRLKTGNFSDMSPKEIAEWLFQNMSGASQLWK